MLAAMADGAPNIADWLEAGGTLAATVVALGIAVSASLAARRREGQRVWATLLIVERACIRFTELLDILEKRAAPNGEISRPRAKAFAASGVFTELNATFAEIRLADMPNPEALEAYLSLRLITRDLENTLVFFGAHNEGNAVVPVAKLQAQAGDVFGTINKARARWKHPLQPEWLLNWRRERLWRARERQIKAEQA